jgi:uncharacterized protein YjbI with pentapeptide repeats
MADQKILSILQQGAVAWNEWISKSPGITVDLRGAVLVGIDLREANLAGADMAEAHL